MFNSTELAWQGRHHGIGRVIFERLHFGIDRYKLEQAGCLFVIGTFWDLSGVNVMERVDLETTSSQLVAKGRSI